MIAGAKDLNKRSGEVCRHQSLLNQLVVVDGQPGCGKTLFTTLISSLDRVEIMNYSTELESICRMYAFDKMTDDAAKFMIKVKLDEMIYETMMSRRTNFRYSDLSSVFSNPLPLRYIKRAFKKGDEIIPEKIKKERPILNLTTHNLLMDSKPLFDAYEDQLTFIEIVRHPLYMVKQQALNMKRLFNMPRDFVTYYQYQNAQVPFFTYGYEKEFLQGNEFDKAIFSMLSVHQRTELFKKNLEDHLKARLITIPFECFVLNPDAYLKQIYQHLDTDESSVTKKIMKKNKVPRTKLANGIDLPIYRRCGWQPSKSDNEFEELELRRQYAIDQGISEQALHVLDQLSQTYEKQYLSDYDWIWKEVEKV
ncbi:MAG: hypothetical protein P8L77_05440 [Gammaproteobacteria bacterium]|nr:hypothetical protein [Gammaproteobacteria bacterium]